MADETPTDALDRIDRAIARIETAMAGRARATETMARRHAALRARMEEAIAALDQIIAQEGEIE
jgi:hypothetical protein